MSLSEAFMRSIIEAPDDDTPRLAYADWLEENGEPARAEFIRVQCRLAAIDEDEPERRELQRREYELLADHGGEWAGPAIGRVQRWQFRRGFIEQVTMEVGHFLKEARWLLDFAPIHELEVYFPRLEDIQALVGSRYIRRIRRLNLDHARLEDAGLVVLARAANLAGLTELSLRFNRFSSASLAELAGSPHLQQLRWLDVRANDLLREAFRDFVASCQLPLESLYWDHAVGLEGIAALSASSLAGRLKELYLRDAKLGAEGLRLLVGSSAFAQLEKLSIGADTTDTAGLAALAAAPWWQRLTRLNLPWVNAGDEGAVELARAPQPAALRRLDLSNNKIGPNGVRALADAPLCRSLTRLSLSGNPLGDAGVKVLARSKQVVSLRRLDLRGCNITGQGAKALLASPHLDRLTCLGLGGNAIGQKAFDQLHARLGERLFHDDFDNKLDGPEIIRRVKAQPPRCLRGLGARTDTELLRRFPRQRLHPAEYASISFELTHPDPQQKAVLLGYADDRGLDIFFSPYAVRWEPSGEQHEFFDAEQHGKSGENDGNCTITGIGKRQPWRCGRRGCRAHTFLVTFIYRIEYPPTRYIDRHLPLADQFYHFDLDAYCATQDRVVEVASFECK
jgi:uncharacterized protein (TIGR02996 family)